MNVMDKIEKDQIIDPFINESEIKDDRFDNITTIIKTSVNDMFMFNQDVIRLLEEYDTADNLDKHHKLLEPVVFSNNFPLSLKIHMIKLLTDEELYSFVVLNPHFISDILPYIDPELVVNIISSISNAVMIPILLRSSTFITKSYILQKYSVEQSDFDLCHKVANGLDPLNIDTINNLSDIHASDTQAEIEEVIIILSEYLTPKYLEALRIKLTCLMKDKKRSFSDLIKMPDLLSDKLNDVSSFVQITGSDIVLKTMNNVKNIYS